MPGLVNLRERLAERVLLWRAEHGRAPERERATAYWAGLRGYHDTSDDDPHALERSGLVADIVGELGAGSLLELGTNTGRNLAVVHDRHPDVRVCGLDVNERALEHARRRRPGIEFRQQDVNAWSEAPGDWDAALTMSVLDHIPDDACEALARNLANTVRYVICVELFDGADGERALFKYSRDTCALFERHGARTLRWELCPVGQYDPAKSPLWLYVGAFGAPT
ncbi:class I SAM-dependent methyltransferase [Capillimicrobium parvum]|uniref:Trans-aconitate 2-methyltransferase n=1 Tax=Capillimicrobium parvum TaxID=2884022 RepID=A0A9E7C6B2_9ACTN|nr:class I SAM-dependent methyltransferase [Capillimicrobium parvum]UGS38712.1 Trans-aconitate 2-methyltransferase [Capillimicrobium parvum]